MQNQSVKWKPGSHVRIKGYMYMEAGQNTCISVDIHVITWIQKYLTKWKRDKIGKTVYTVQYQFWMQKWSLECGNLKARLIPDCNQEAFRGAFHNHVLYNPPYTVWSDITHKLIVRLFVEGRKRIKMSKMKHFWLFPSDNQLVRIITFVIEND
jgi:hypothetical protein